MKAANSLIWGFATALAALIVVAVLAFVPDPFFRERVIAASFDNVEGVARGAPIFFRGSQIGTVRSVDLDAPTRLFDVGLGVRRDWRPSSCSFARIAEANPLTTPHIELVALEVPATQCQAARLAAQCDRVPLVPSRGATIDGCRRNAGLFETAALAVGQAAAVAKTANAMAARLGTMLGSDAPGGSPVNMAKVAQDSTAALAALSGISRKLDDSLAPGRGDVALTLANVRRATGRAGDFDVASVNGTLRDVRTLVGQNQANVTGILSEGRVATTQTRALLEELTASLATTSANLARASDSMTALTERLAQDPSSVVRGRKFENPPAPGSKP